MKFKVKLREELAYGILCATTNAAGKDSSDPKGHGNLELKLEGTGIRFQIGFAFQFDHMVRCECNY
jgi:hypothetical protein